MSGGNRNPNTTPKNPIKTLNPEAVILSDCSLNFSGNRDKIFTIKIDQKKSKAHVVITSQANRSQGDSRGSTLGGVNTRKNAIDQGINEIIRARSDDIMIIRGNRKKWSYCNKIKC